MDLGPAILDTDTLSELSRGNLRVQERARNYLEEHGRLTITAVTVFERLRGYRLALKKGKPFEKQLRAFEALAASCHILPFDDEAASVAALLWANASAAERQKLGDLLIAASAISRRLPLVTRNQRDFSRLAAGASLELRLVDWTESGRGKRLRL